PTGHTFLSITKWGILQYVIMKPIITFISLITEALGVFCAESLSFAFARVYMKILTFICVTIAMYALVVLYLTIKDDIANENPFLKFLCIKLVIFFAFWQSVVLSIVAELEMTVFSFLHIFAFPYQPYEELGNHEKVSITKGLIDSFNPIDIWREMVYVWDTLTRRKFPKNNSKDFLATYRLPRCFCVFGKISGQTKYSDRLPCVSAFLETLPRVAYTIFDLAKFLETQKHR
ncbi:13024_t:CDS:2, partial [Racocetra persica]